MIKLPIGWVGHLDVIWGLYNYRTLDGLTHVSDSSSRVGRVTLDAIRGPSVTQVTKPHRTIYPDLIRVGIKLLYSALRSLPPLDNH